MTGHEWRVAGAIVLLSALALGLGYKATHRMPPPVVRVDTASAAAWRQVAEKRQAELTLRDGVIGRLKDELEGLEQRKPQRIVVYDTVIPPAETRRDTVLRYLVATGGRVSVGALLPEDSAGGRRPVELQRIDVRDCDDGFAIAATGTICNRARWGHLELGVGVNASVRLAPVGELPQAAALAGARWRPSFRSTFEARAHAAAGTQGPRLEVGVWKGVRLW